MGHRLAIANLATATLAVVLLAVWFAVPRDPFAGVGSYLPFHMFAETFSIVVSMMIFGLMWNAYSSERPGGLVILSCTMLSAGLLDFGHMLSVSGMPALVTASSPDKGIAFWLSARTMAAAGFVVAALRPEASFGGPRSRYLLLGLSLGITVLVYWAALFHLEALPRFFVDGSGLTPFKITAEYLLAGVLAAAAIVFYLRARRSPTAMQVGLCAAAAISFLSELFFAIYAAKHDLFQVLGHAYKVLAYLLVYQAVFIRSVREPFENLHREIAERKRAEDDVRRANQGLEQRVLQRTADLEAANKELEAFAYSVSHELRAPLTPVLTAVQLMQRTPDTSENMRRQLEIIQRNVQLETRLIADLLAFSRLSQQPLEKELVDHKALVSDVLQSLLAERPARQVDIAVGELPAVEADPRLLKQVWVNLLANALKYTRSRERAVIRVGSQIEDGVPVYYVRDNGVGFDMLHAQKLFKVFQRLHRAEEYEGTGVGLVIVQRIIDRHGGRIWTQASNNEGAAFYFTLQAAQRAGQ